MIRGRMLVPLLALAACLGTSLAAVAADKSAYAEWTASGQSGTVAVPGVGFPEGTFTSTSSSLRVPSGASAFLNAATPFGQEFGSSQNKQYLQFRSASGGGPSTTTITFDKPTTPGFWGFALGDIDADHVQISATGSDGSPLTAAELGWKSGFNFCSGSPRPSSCGSGTHTDRPTWDAATSTLVGNVTDTTGATGWFMPTRAVKSLTLVFTVQSGIPVGQLWIAAKWNGGKPDIILEKSASPAQVKPGGTVTYTVTVTNKGTVPEQHAEFTDDLSDVVDDATFNDDARADAGTTSYTAPKLTWKGPVDPGQTRTITYSATVNDPPHGNRKILNAVIGVGGRMGCDTCVVAVKIKKPHRHHRHHHGHIPRDACRLTRSSPAAGAVPGC